MPKAALKAESGFITLNGERIAFSVFRSKRRRRTIAFKFESDKGLRILAPFSASLSSVARILENRAPWILRELSARKKENANYPFTDGAVFSYLGYPCVLSVTEGGGDAGSCLLSPRALRVNIPQKGLSFETLQQEVRLEILLWVKKRARVKLKRRLDLWAERLGVEYKRFVMASPESRWGSCSADNVIRLNWKLIMAPLPVLDYVVAHELSHIRHKDHSARFWAFLARAMPNYQMHRKALRQVERNLI
jgi:predicted metal-dependent hydrolase